MSNFEDMVTTEEFGQLQKVKIGDSRVRQLYLADRIFPIPEKRGGLLWISKNARILPPKQKASKIK